MGLSCKVPSTFPQSFHLLNAHTSVTETFHPAYKESLGRDLLIRPSLVLCSTNHVSLHKIVFDVSYFIVVVIVVEDLGFTPLQIVFDVSYFIIKTHIYALLTTQNRKGRYHWGYICSLF